MDRAPVPGGWLAYELTGNGPTVVLLHGGAFDLRLWDAQIESLSREFQVLRFDARSHGQSATGTVPFRQCDDVAALLQYLDIARASLIGLSMGGGTAVDTALEYPALVQALVVCGAGTNEPSFTDPWTLEQQARMWRAQEQRDPEAWVDAFLVAYLAGPHRHLAQLDQAVVARCRTMAIETLGTHTSRPESVLPEQAERPWQRLGEIQVPLLGLAGSLDCPDHLAMVKRLVDGVSGARLALIEGAAHYPNLERPDAFNQEVLEFLRSVALNRGRRPEQHRHSACHNLDRAR
jgi:pimeloyl-ACP methyl ester carboxylesterase